MAIISHKVLSVRFVGCKHLALQLVLLDSKFSSLLAFWGEGGLTLDQTTLGSLDLSLEGLEALLNIGHQVLDLVFFMGDELLELFLDTSCLCFNCMECFHDLGDLLDLVCKVVYE